ncbi:hypothetical protein AB4072_15320 [Microvirga sp. 2MCAF38]|uniref:hypothetical protein n=1 Tax=Microvirga sp. 2MCAF38 TaxID=3232989 RepID=UPI003F9577DB
MGSETHGGDERHAQEGNPAWDELKDDVTHLAQEARAQGRHFVDAAREQAADYAEERKDGIANSVSNLANTLREATQTFDDRPNIRAIVDSAAEGLDQLADAIQERQISEIVTSIEGVMRRHPVPVAALSIGLGFLAARFIKSTARDLRDSGAPSEHEKPGLRGKRIRRSKVYG